jgi:hypothetical protein
MSREMVSRMVNICVKSSWEYGRTLKRARDIHDAM